MSTLRSLTPRIVLLVLAAIGALAFVASPASTLGTPPTITSAPPAVTSSTSATFTFALNGAPIGFCRVDGGAEQSCSGTVSYSGLSEGTHLFEVRGSYLESATDRTSYRWSIDRTAPNTTIESAVDATGTLRHTLHASERGARLQCKVVSPGSDGRWASCETVVTIALREYTLFARSIDAAGNIDSTPASYTHRPRA